MPGSLTEMRGMARIHRAEYQMREYTERKPQRSAESPCKSAA